MPQENGEPTCEKADRWQKMGRVIRKYLAQNGQGWQKYVEGQDGSYTMADSYETKNNSTITN